MFLKSGQALHVILSQTAYCSNEHYQESAENKGRNPICLIFCIFRQSWTKVLRHFKFPEQI